MLYSFFSQFNLTWEGHDTESPVHDYEVSLGASQANGDILPFKSTTGQQGFLTYHPNLVNGLEFFVAIRATNKADLETTKVRIQLSLQCDFCTKSLPTEAYNIIIPVLHIWHIFFFCFLSSYFSRHLVQSW